MPSFSKYCKLYNAVSLQVWWLGMLDQCCSPHIFSMGMQHGRGVGTAGFVKRFPLPSLTMAQVFIVLTSLLNVHCT